jgi:hypothetical protein
MVIDVKKCSACGQDHKRIQTVELVNPIFILDKIKPYDRFFMCPVKGQQVFVRQAQPEKK